MALAIDPLWHLAAAGFTAVVFLRAVADKAAQFAIFAATLRGYRLLPAIAATPVAVVLVLAEAATLLLLPLPATRPLGGAIAIALLTLYAAAMAMALVRGRTEIECGCGGSGQLVSWSLVGRNAALVVIAAALLMPVASRTLGWLEIVAAAAATAIGWLLLAAAEKTIETAAAARRLANESYL